MSDREAPIIRNLILVVDDDLGVLRTISATLAHAGFRVEVADGGDAGLAAYRKFRQEICVVLTDVVMPGLNGVGLAQAILEIDPSARILFMSGYSEAPPEIDSRRFPFVRKPFLPADLVRRVRRVLGQAAGAV